MAIFSDRRQIRSLSNNGLGRAVDIIKFRYRYHNGLPLLFGCLFVLSVEQGVGLVVAVVVVVVSVVVSRFQRPRPHLPRGAWNAISHASSLSW